ncbi:MAG: hypothetical protein ACR2JY_01715 [Chloroflexota bacterium]
MARGGSFVAAVVALLVSAIITGAEPVRADGCTFVLGFATLEALLPAQVGHCLDNEAFNPVNGDTLQHTSGGLLVWRRLDNWTALTNGYHTWVNGPNGLQERLNGQRFAWEANPDGLPSAGLTGGAGLQSSHDCGATPGYGKVQSLCPPP